MLTVGPLGRCLGPDNLDTSGDNIWADSCSVGSGVSEILSFNDVCYWGGTVG